MQKLHFLFLLSCFVSLLHAQQKAPLAGKVADAITGEPLQGASISMYKAGMVSGLVSNGDGRFSIAEIATCDSLKISMIGYHSRTFHQQELINLQYLDVQLNLAPAVLKEVVVKPRAAIDIIKEVISKMDAYLPGDEFESTFFYREIIKDRKDYFSVAEAVFRAQYFPQKHSYKLQLIQGRSKQDVAYTRLFEDFVPGGGPQSVAGNSFLTGRPDFLNLKKINDFDYSIDSLLQFDGELLYSISFDQKPGVKEALEKGRLLVTVGGYAVVRYEAANSLAGSAYIKNLTGTDKIFADLLNIDFKRKGWKRRVDFTKLNDKWLMSYAAAEHAIAYKQPKKDLDIDLTINIELLVTSLQSPVQKEIRKEEEWKNKNIIANLPGVFDSAYWGANNIIAPTDSINHIVAGIASSNHEIAAAALPGWQWINHNFFVASQHHDTITLIPFMKCVWEDDETGGMLYREIKGNFTVTTKINLVKYTATDGIPDRGFQQAGIIVRNYQDSMENYLLLTTGTGGNPNPKIFFKKTEDNKSKTVVNKSHSMNSWLKMERNGNTITAFFKEAATSNWIRMGTYELNWLQDRMQLGLAVFARFPGDGPKMQPDMKAMFSQFTIENE